MPVCTVCTLRYNNVLACIGYIIEQRGFANLHLPEQHDIAHDSFQPILDDYYYENEELPGGIVAEINGRLCELRCNGSYSIIHL